MDFSFLSGTNLFQGISQEEIKQLLPCLGGQEKNFQKDEVIFYAGDTTTRMGLVLSGSVNIIVNFYWGSSQIFGHVGAGDIFGQNYAAIPGQELNCDIAAAEPSKILFMDMNRLLTTCRGGCAFHTRIICNLVRISAQRSLSLSSRMLHIAPKSIRGRVLSYLSEQSVKNGSNRFVIPFSRQQLADYLGVDRSALSGELGRMQRDGLILCRKSDFTLLKQGEATAIVQ